MTPDSVMSLGRQAMEVTLLVSAPLLLVALAIGLVVSIFQAATQINETTLSFIPNNRVGAPSSFAKKPILEEGKSNLFQKPNIKQNKSETK